MELLAFYIFAAIVTVSALAVVAARNPVHSVLWLILAFFTSAGLLVLIGAEFLAMLLVVVYVGAVAVFGIAFLAEIALAGFARETGNSALFNAAPGADTNAEAIGQVMYTEYFLLFQLAGLILLVAMIGAIVLTLRHKPGVKRQDIAKQTARRRRDATEAVQVEPGMGL